MKLAGIIGHPLGHSLSPAFQGAAFAAAGLDIRYEAWDTPPEELPRRVAGLRAAEIVGANVTIPYKEDVVALMDGLEGQARRMGAVNTIVNRGGQLIGHNTDGPGFIAALRTEAGFEPKGAAVLLLGAGGAARGIAFALAHAGVGAVAIWNRRAERAERLAAELRSLGCTASRAAAPDLLDCDLVVNCTSVGMVGGSDESGVPCDVARARAGTLVADIVYRPAETPLLRAARAAGLPVLEGLPMLIYQGALAFELWTGVAAPVPVMFEAARAALARDRA